MSAALLADHRDRLAVVVDGGRAEVLTGHERATDAVLPRERYLQLDRRGLVPQQQDLFAGQPRGDFRARLELRGALAFQFLQQGFRLERAGRQAEGLPVHQSGRVGVERFVELDQVAVQEQLPGAPGPPFLQALPGSLDPALCLAQVLGRKRDHFQFLRLPGQRTLDEFELRAQTFLRGRRRRDHQLRGLRIASIAEGKQLVRLQGQGQALVGRLHCLTGGHALDAGIAREGGRHLHRIPGPVDEVEPGVLLVSAVPQHCRVSIAERLHADWWQGAVLGQERT